MEVPYSKFFVPFCSILAHFLLQTVRVDRTRPLTRGRTGISPAEICWLVGLLACWYVGMLVCWYVGMLVCWYVYPWVRGSVGPWVRGSVGPWVRGRFSFPQIFFQSRPPRDQVRQRVEDLIPDPVSLHATPRTVSRPPLQLPKISPSPDPA
jgi:hypothetical protein